MVFDYVVGALVDRFGYDIMVAFLFIVCFCLIGMFRGLGITALLIVFFMSTYLFATMPINNYYLISSDWQMVIIILGGMFAGFLVYSVFWRE